MVTLTERAARQISALAAKKGLAPVLRLRVSAGGCSGMSYEFEVDGKIAADDVVFELAGAKLAVDPRSDFFVGGSVVDYEESLMQSGFAVKNPQAVSTCSCGKSFATGA